MMGEKRVKTLFTFVAITDAIENPHVLKHLRCRPEVEVVLIGRDDPLPSRDDQIVVALVQCSEELNCLFERLPGRSLLAPPAWAVEADCVVGVTKPPPLTPRRAKQAKDNLHHQTDSFKTRQAVEAMLSTWTFRKKERKKKAA